MKRKIIRFGACVKFKDCDMIEEYDREVSIRKEKRDFKTTYFISVFGFILPYWTTTKQNKYTILANRD